ncbi:RNA recognition motif domain-containing protein [Ditylenchus destructor]|nr:RNA recognition motif domain-containing protein [Ditylenchus destructor]
MESRGLLRLLSKIRLLRMYAGHSNSICSRHLCVLSSSFGVQSRRTKNRNFCTSKPLPEDPLEPNKHKKDSRIKSLISNLKHIDTFSSRSHILDAPMHHEYDISSNRSRQRNDAANTHSDSYSDEFKPQRRQEFHPNRYKHKKDSQTNHNDALSSRSHILDYPRHQEFSSNRSSQNNDAANTRSSSYSDQFRPQRRQEFRPDRYKMNSSLKDVKNFIRIDTKNLKLLMFLTVEGITTTPEQFMFVGCQKLLRLKYFMNIFATLELLPDALFCDTDPPGSWNLQQLRSHRAAPSARLAGMGAGRLRRFAPIPALIYLKSTFSAFQKDCISMHKPDQGSAGSDCGGGRLRRPPPQPRAEKVLELFPHFIDGREVHVENRTTRDLIDNYRILIYGLPKDATSYDLKDYFSKFGDVVFCRIPPDQKLLSRGFGTVAFKSEKVVDLVLNSTSHYICNRMVTVEKHKDKSRTVFVATLSKFTTKDTLCAHFRNFGQITYCFLAKDQNSETSLEYAHVEFATIEQAQSALKYDSHVIDGKKVSVIWSRDAKFGNEYRCFVGSLPKTTTEESVREYFSKFGEIFSCNLVRNQNSSSRGFAYVSFTSQDSVDRVLNESSHYIDDKLVNVEFSISRKKEFTIQISALPPYITKEMLSAFYSKYGELKACSVQIDHKTGTSRTFGHVTFSEKEEVDRAMADQPHFIEGVKVIPSLVQDKLELFINYLSPKTTEYTLENFFSRYGQVQRLRLIRDRTGIRAVVKFYSGNEILKAVNDRPHIIDGKLVLSFQKGQDYTVFVDNLPKSATEDELREVFSKFGKVVHWQIRRDCAAGKPDGYGYVTFSTAEEERRIGAFVPRSHFPKKTCWSQHKKDSQTNHNDALSSRSHILDYPRHQEFSSNRSSQNNDAANTRSDSYSDEFKPQRRQEFHPDRYKQYNNAATTRADSYSDEFKTQRRQEFHPDRYKRKIATTNPRTDSSFDVFDRRRRYDRSRAIYVSGLSKSTTPEVLYEYFRNIGTVTGCNLLRQRPTGIVEFATVSEAEKVLELFPHFIDGREVHVENRTTHDLMDKYRILIYGLPKDTTSYDLKDYFSKFGDVVFCRIPPDQKYSSRGFGFVAFKSQEVVDLVMNSTPHRIGNRMVTVETQYDKSRTVFVATLSKFTTKDTLCAHFRNFGQVTYCNLAKDQNSETSLQYAHVEFATIEQAQSAFKYDSHVIDGKKVNVTIGGDAKLSNEYRCFVAPLLKTTTEESVRQYFSKFGEIFHCNLVRNEDSSSRGMAYVTFTSQDSVDRVCNESSHYVDDKLVNVTFSRTRKKELTIQISELPPYLTEEMLSAFYSKYGQLRGCSVQIDPKTGKSRKFGHVIFSAKEEVDRAMADQPHFIEGVKVIPALVQDKLELFINYLSPKTTEYTLENFFSRYGQVQRLRLIRDRTGIRAVVKFYSGNEILKAVDDRPHFIDDKYVLSFRKGQDYTVFVDNLPKSATEDELRDVFSKFGKVVHWQIRRGYGYVTFSTAEEAACATKSTLLLDGKPLSVTPLIKEEFHEKFFDENICYTHRR